MSARRARVSRMSEPPAPCSAGYTERHGRADVSPAALLGPIDRPDRLPARLPRLLQPRRHRRARAHRPRSTAVDARAVTDGYICGKVRRFDRRVYGADRLLHPAVRTGPKGRGEFARVTWDEALDLIAERDARGARRASAPRRSCPIYYGGSNGLLTQRPRGRAVLPALRRLAARAHGVRRADRRGGHGDVRQDGRRRLRGLRRTRG